MNKIAIYTGLFTDDPNTLYGDIIPYEHKKDGIDYIAFTNSDHLKSDFWDIRKIDCDRNCLYQETQAALGRNPKRDEPETLINQAEQYKSEGYPQGIGLYENGILFRRNNEHTNNFNKLWFEETAKWNTEDQISMMYSLWKTPEVKVNPIKKTFVEHNYKNTHLTLTDQFGCQSRTVRNVR